MQTFFLVAGALLFGAETVVDVPEGQAGANAAAVRAEAPYAFRARLERVHEPNRRDASLVPAADEFAFTDGCAVADADLADYLKVSMGVDARVKGDGERGTDGMPALVATFDHGLSPREYVVDVTKAGVKIRAYDERALRQACYHLEDLMNLRRAPFIRIGTERRRMRFSPRMIHSGYACDVFPDNYLKLVAHHGFDAIVFYIKDVDRTAAGPDQRVNDLIARAKRVGLDTYLYSSVSCFAHPDDPKGRSEIEASFGRIAKAHPGAKGIVFVGESCQFPSKDPRVQPVRHRDRNHADPRPLAGWFPCRDYPDWLKAVMDVLHRHSPQMEIVFWTYNWSRQDAQACADLIPRFPDGVAIQGTLGNGAVTKHDNGLVCTCRDYTVSTPGFTDHYAAQAKAAKASGRRFYTMANTAGLTWDYGTSPYLPCPFQWKKRWDGLVDPQYGIAGLMETHHFGWYPSFISELAKEAYTEGGIPFDEHIRKIAARDYGEANADAVVEAWRKWSRTEVDYVANNENQYGPFRIGPAFPYNFGGKKIAHAEFPQDRRAYHTMRWMAILNFPFDLEQAREQNIAFTELDDAYRLRQLELFERMRADWADGARVFRAIGGAKAAEMAGVGEWHQRAVETAINLNRGYLAFRRGDRAGVLRYARAEYENARAALELAERDSRLGWEPSMEYAAGPEQIRWKLARMEALYGEAAAVSPDGANEIRLWTTPLAYEVRRHGKTVVAKTEIGLKVDGKTLPAGLPSAVTARVLSGEESTPVYKKAKISLAGSETFVDFGAWGVRLVARNDGVAYRFETRMPGTVTVNCEKAPLTVPDSSARCWVNFTGGFGKEESVPQALSARDIRTKSTGVKSWRGGEMVYLPFAYAADGAFVVVTESDVRDYPIWNFVRADGCEGAVRLDSKFAGWPLRTQRVGGWGKELVDRGGRWVRVAEHGDFLTKTAGTRTYPWRTFVLADSPSKVCEADIVRALAPAAEAGADFGWVKPGKVAWDWWNCFDNAPEGAKNGGCTTKTYERFIDFAAKTGVEYVIFDEGWSESLNIWKFHPEVDVPHLIRYANRRNVGIILWMAWAQVCGEEERVASHFAKLGAKGFKVDFMDRGDAEVANFLEKFAAACARHGMLVDYHGVYRPNGLQRRYPNVLNYEGIHGLEQLKWFPGGPEAEAEMMANDVRAFYLRLTAGPMDYTPGAMLNHAVGTGYRGEKRYPGSVGTRCRQMAMMVLYEAPLQMLCDSPSNYERNMESFAFMAGVPVVWDDTVALGGCPDSLAAAARKARDGSWYAAAITTVDARDFAFKTDFLGGGEWQAEIFRDAPDADRSGAHYVRERRTIAAGAELSLHLAPGGGFAVKFVRSDSASR